MTTQTLVYEKGLYVFRFKKTEQQSSRNGRKSSQQSPLI